MTTRNLPADPAPRERLIPCSEVQRLTGLSRSTIYAWMRQGRFPKPVRVGRRAVRWRLEEVLEFIATRPRTR